MGAGPDRTLITHARVVPCSGDATERAFDGDVLVDGEVRSVTRATLSLTWDHRVIDGAPAAEFCRTIARHRNPRGPARTCAQKCPPR